MNVIYICYCGYDLVRLPGCTVVSLNDCVDVRVLVKNVEKMQEAMPMTDMDNYANELEKVSVLLNASLKIATIGSVNILTVRVIFSFSDQTWLSDEVNGLLNLKFKM